MSSRAAMQFWVAAALAGVAACEASPGTPEPAPPPTCDIVAGATVSQCDALRASVLPESLPPASGNAVGDSDDAARFGQRIFFDARLSSDQEQRCAGCHLPENFFVDNKPVSQGLALGNRNAPTMLNAAREKWMFWDGRADTLWSQPLFALENKKEMGFSRLEIAHQIDALFKDLYTGVFGAFPGIQDQARFPLKGAPGDPAWDAMSADDQKTINTVVANIGKVLEAYVRKIASGRAPFDNFFLGDRTALTDAQTRGLSVFVRAKCLDCHSGPTLSDSKFHNLGVPAVDGAAPDRGRADGIGIREASLFNALGAFYEGPRAGDERDAPVAPVDADLGAFKTPSLRNLSYTAPYGHNGRYTALRDIIEFHLQGGGRGGTGFVGDVDPLVQPITLTEQEKIDLLEFLTTGLLGAYPPKPWNDWIDR
jgi:cytochrome c peroxidase